jgi:hypothetical protein
MKYHHKFSCLLANLGFSINFCLQFLLPHPVIKGSPKLPKEKKTAPNICKKYNFYLLLRAWNSEGVLEASGE